MGVFFGVAKVSNIFLLLDIPDFFFGGGGGRRSDAGSEPTHEEKMRVPPPPPGVCMTHGVIGSH